MSSLDFTVVPTSETYQGKTYSQLIGSWCNWFFMSNPDQYNQDTENNIKFLRSFPSPAKIAAYSPGERIPFEGSPMYLNLPNVMTGPDRIVMFEDQAVFFPVILALWINDDDKDFGFMERWVKNENFNSDNPPLPTQFTINGLPIISSREVLNYKVDSSGVFMLNIPNATYGTSLKDFVIDPSPPGTYETYCQGYFFLVKGLKPDKTYEFYSRARGAPYSAGPYYSSFKYEIQVLPNSLRPISPSGGVFPERLFDSMKDDIMSQKNAGRLSDPQAELLLNRVETSKKSDLCYVEHKNDASALQNAIMVLLLGDIRNRLIGVEESEITDPSNKILDRLEKLITTKGDAEPGWVKSSRLDKSLMTQTDQIIKKSLNELLEKTNNPELENCISKLDEWYIDSFNSS